jgi:hypothetical protein
MPDKKLNPNRRLLMLNCLLLSRTREGSGQLSPESQAAAAHPLAAASAGDRATGASDARFNEEIGAYIASLSKAVSNPDHVEHLTPYLFAYDLEVLERLAKCEDGSVKYLILRAKDDVLVMAAAILDEAGGAALPEGPPFKHGSQGQMGRGPAYFHFAFAFSKQVTNPAEASVIVEENLPPGLWKYSTILAYVTGQDFEFRDRFADAEVYHLVRTVEKTGRRIRLERKQNEFLDAYRDWRDSHTEEARLKMITVAGELRKLDPTFCYTPK